MKFKGYTLISDLDGTLLSDDKKISQKNLEAINYFIEEGGQFTIATGRAQARVRMYHDVLKVTLPAVFLNGTVVGDYETGENLWSLDLNPKAKELAEKILSHYPQIGLEVYAHNTNYFIYVNEFIKEHMQAEGFAQNFCSLSEVPFPWQKLFLGCKEDVLKILHEDFSQYEPYFHFTKSGDVFYEVLEKGVNKGVGLLKLIELTGIDPNKIITVGDNLNDVEFLKQGAISVGVGNACPEILAFADIVVADNNHSPLHDLILKLEERD